MDFSGVRDESGKYSHFTKYFIFRMCIYICLGTTSPDTEDHHVNTRKPSSR